MKILRVLVMCLFLVVNVFAAEKFDAGKMRKALDQFCSENNLVGIQFLPSMTRIDHLNIGVVHLDQAAGEKQDSSAMYGKNQEFLFEKLIKIVHDNKGEKEILINLEGIDTFDKAVQRKYGLKDQYFPRKLAAKLQGVLIPDSVLMDKSLKFKIIGVDNRTVGKNISMVMDKLGKFRKQGKVNFILRNKKGEIIKDGDNMEFFAAIGCNFEVKYEKEFAGEFDKFIKDEVMPAHEDNLRWENRVRQQNRKEIENGRFVINMMGSMHLVHFFNNIIIEAKKTELGKMVSTMITRRFFDFFFRKK